MSKPSFEVEHRQSKADPEGGVGTALTFNLDGGKVSLHAVRPDAPPKIVSAAYELVAHTDERDQRPELLHKKVRKYDTISNTISAAAPLDGTIRRKT